MMSSNTHVFHLGGSGIMGICLDQYYQKFYAVSEEGYTYTM